MRTQTLALALLLATVVAVAACSGSNSSGSQPGANMGSQPGSQGANKRRAPDPGAHKQVVKLSGVTLFLNKKKAASDSQSDRKRPQSKKLDQRPPNYIPNSVNKKAKRVLSGEGERFQ